MTATGLARWDSFFFFFEMEGERERERREERKKGNVPGRQGKQQVALKGVTGLPRRPKGARSEWRARIPLDISFLNYAPPVPEHLLAKSTSPPRTAQCPPP